MRLPQRTAVAGRPGRRKLPRARAVSGPRRRRGARERPGTEGAAGRPEAGAPARGGSGSPRSAGRTARLFTDVFTRRCKWTPALRHRCLFWESKGPAGLWKAWPPAPSPCGPSWSTGPRGRGGGGRPSPAGRRLARAAAGASVPMGGMCTVRDVCPARGSPRPLAPEGSGETVPSTASVPGQGGPDGSSLAAAGPGPPPPPRRLRPPALVFLCPSGSQNPGLTKPTEEGLAPQD